MYYIHQKRVEALNWNLIEPGLGISLEMKNPILELENPIIDWKLIGKCLKLDLRLLCLVFILSSNVFYLKSTLGFHFYRNLEK